MLVTNDKQKEIKKHNPDINLAEYLILTRVKNKNDEHLYDQRVQLLNDYFKSNNKIVDLAVVLYGGLSFMDVLEPHQDQINLLFFRPQHTYKWDRNRNPFLVGEVNPEHNLLIFDSDMLTGESIREASQYFGNQGYSINQMQVYLAWGLPHNNMNPVLEPVNSVLKKGFTVEDLIK